VRSDQGDQGAEGGQHLHPGLLAGEVDAVLAEKSFQGVGVLLISPALEAGVPAALVQTLQPEVK
jgi:hypothetical protein